MECQISNPLLLSVHDAEPMYLYSLLYFMQISYIIHIFISLDTRAIDSFN